jgi:hypothetical protein
MNDDDEPRIEQVDLKSLQPGPIQHPNGLPAPLEKWARSLYERVGLHIYDSFEQWELGFMRDLQPQNEMFVWEAIAQAYESWIGDHPNCDKADVAGKLAGISMGGKFDAEVEARPETPLLRAVWETAWQQFTAEPDGRFREIWDRLGLDE